MEVTMRSTPSLKERRRTRLDFAGQLGARLPGLMVFLVGNNGLTPKDSFQHHLHAGVPDSLCQEIVPEVIIRTNFVPGLGRVGCRLGHGRLLLHRG